MCGFVLQQSATWLSFYIIFLSLSLIFLTLLKCFVLLHSSKSVLSLSRHRSGALLSRDHSQGDWTHRCQQWNLLGASCFPNSVMDRCLCDLLWSPVGLKLAPQGGLLESGSPNDLSHWVLGCQRGAPLGKHLKLKGRKKAIQKSRPQCVKLCSIMTFHQSYVHTESVWSHPSGL